MKKLMLIICVAFLFAGGFLWADDEVVQPIAESVVESTPDLNGDNVSFGKGVLLFLNSPLGVSVVIFVLSFIMGKIFTAKPKWKALVLKYGPSIMQAVKVAEKKIPDDTENSSLSKLDAALKYLIELEPKLKNMAEADIKTAISAVHASAEANGNLENK